MNLTQISNRLEIVFWTTWVAALRSPRLGRLALPGLLAGACTLIVIISTAWLLPPAAPKSILAAEAAAGGTGRARHVAAAGSLAVAARPANGQRNLLVILVDRLDASQPRLDGIWLLARIPDPAQVTFLPVYPSFDSQGQDFDRRLETDFQSGKEEPFSGEFQQTLEAQGLWWDHYLMVDTAGMALLVERIGSVDAEEGQSLAQLSENAQDPQSALAYQLQLAQQACSHAPELLSDMAPSALAALFEKNSRSDLDPKQLRLILRSLPGTGGIVCQFPVIVGR